jgi:hypothetical protein
MYLRICGSLKSAKNLGTQIESLQLHKTVCTPCMLYSVRVKQLSYLCNLLSVSHTFFVCRGFILKKTLFFVEEFIIRYTF